MGLDSPGSIPGGIPLFYLGEPQATRVLDAGVRVALQPRCYSPQRRLDANHSSNSIPDLSRFTSLFLENWRPPGHRQGYRPQTERYQAGMVIRQVCSTHHSKNGFQRRRFAYLCRRLLVLLGNGQHPSVKKPGSIPSGFCNPVELVRYLSSQVV